MIKSFCQYTWNTKAGWYRASLPSLAAAPCLRKRGGAWGWSARKDLPWLALFLNHALVDAKITRRVGLLRGQSPFSGHDHHGHPLAGARLFHQLSSTNRPPAPDPADEAPTSNSIIDGAIASARGDGYPLPLAAVDRPRGLGVALSPSPPSPARLRQVDRLAGAAGMVRQIHRRYDRGPSGTATCGNQGKARRTPCRRWQHLVEVGGPVVGRQSRWAPPTRLR